MKSKREGRKGRDGRGRIGRRNEEERAGKVVCRKRRRRGAAQLPTNKMA